VSQSNGRSGIDAFRMPHSCGPVVQVMRSTQRIAIIHAMNSNRLLSSTTHTAALASFEDGTTPAAVLPVYAYVAKALGKAVGDGLQNRRFNCSLTNLDDEDRTAQCVVRDSRASHL
jgi:hypothetical protein